MVPDTWQMLKYYKWMPVMTKFVFILHLSWILVPLPLGFHIDTSNSINPNLEFFPSGLFPYPTFPSYLFLPPLFPSFLSPVIDISKLELLYPLLPLSVSYQILSILLPNSFWHSLFNAFFPTVAFFRASYHFLLCQLQSLLIYLLLNFNDLKTKYITIFKEL